MVRASSNIVRGGSPELWRQALLVTTATCCWLLAACKDARREQPATSNAVATAPVVAAPAVSAPPSAMPRSEHVKVPPEVRETCHKICDHSTQLKCKHADECLANCYGMASLTPCSTEFNALFPCLVREPPEHWECGEDGIGTIRAGYCDKEQSEAVACMEKKMQE